MNPSLQGTEALDEAHEQWMRHLPSDIREEFSKAKVRASLASMPDATPVGVDLAAVYLCTSVATLKRMRSEGTGPTYLQPKTNEGTTARNQKISYLMGELKRWLQEQSTSSTMHAAELRGTMFASLLEATIPQLLWLQDHKGVRAVVGHVLSTPLTSDLISEQNSHIEWLDWAEALRLPWIHKNQRAVFEAPFKRLISEVLDGVHAGLESSELLEGLSSLPKSSN